MAGVGSEWTRTSGTAEAVALGVLAGTAELGFRSVATAPYAPTASDLVLAFALYLLSVVPALVAARFLERLPWLRGPSALFACAPFVLLLANGAFVFHVENTPLRPTMLVVAVAGLGLGLLVRRYADLRLLAGAAALCLVVGGAQRFERVRGPGRVRPNVLLVVLDTTSASHLSAYGYDRPTTPNLTALARRSLVYRRAVSAAPWTIPSHAAIFSGRYPEELGFDGTDFRRFVPGSIASDLVATGRQAVAISGNPLIGCVGELSAGFGAAWAADKLVRPFPIEMLDRWRGHDEEFETQGARVTSLALDWLDRVAARDRPWFLFVNYIDPHMPYQPPERERRQFAPGVDPRAVAYEGSTYNSGKVPLTPELRSAIRGLYDAEIASMDAALGRLLAELVRRGYDDSNLLVIVSADHGESLGDHGFLGHLLGMTDAVLHVPLLIRGPGVRPGHVDVPVQTLQLRATLRALLGLDPMPDIAPPLPPWGEAPDLLISEHPEPGWYLHRELPRYNPNVNVDTWRGNWVAVERAGVKVLFDDGGRGATYHLASDPGEEHPGPRADGESLIEAYAARHPGAWQVPAQMSEEKRRALLGTGYVH